MTNLSNDENVGCYWGAKQTWDPMRWSLLSSFHSGFQSPRGCGLNCSIIFGFYTPSHPLRICRAVVESQQRQTRDRRGVSRDSDASSDSESEDDMPSSAAPGGKKKPSAEAAQSAEAAEDFLASIPLPAEPPPPDSASATAIQ